MKFLSNRKVLAWFFGVFSIVLLLAGCSGGGGSGNNGELIVPPPAVLVAYKMYGVGFGPYLNGQDPASNQLISDSQLQSRLQIVAPYTQWVRTFGSENGLENIPRIAKGLGLKVAAGAYLSANAASNEKELSNLIAVGNSGQADMLIVGNETLQSRSLTESQLIGYIQRVRLAVPIRVKVTTVDTYNQLLAHPNVMMTSDVVAANFYPYFEGIDLRHAVAYLDAKYEQLLAQAGGKEIIVAETGWPSGGIDHGGSVVSPENAASYFVNFVSWAREKGVKYFYFESFDEAWKVSVEGPQGSHWGIWDENGAMKPGMHDVFDGETVPDNWSGTALIGGFGTPTVSMNVVPSIGSNDNLIGSIMHVIPADYKVAVYIKVASGWWTKPYAATPLTLILPDGSWVCDITTGGSDTLATEIAAFLIPNSYTPPMVLNATVLPAELGNNAVAQTTVTR